MHYKLTIIFDDIMDLDQADEYTSKIMDFVSDEITEDWIAFGGIVAKEDEE